MVSFTADIRPYSLDGLSDWNHGLGWSVERSRSAVLIHDLLPYYLSVLDQDLRAELLVRCSRLVDDAVHHGVPVIASAPRPATCLEQRGLGGRLWGRGPSADEARTPAIPQLESPTVPWMAKRSLSAFYATDLEVELRRLGRDQLIIAGVFASGGVLASTFDALARDIEVFVVADAVADYTIDLHRSSLDTVARSTGQVCSCDIVRSAWSKQLTSPASRPKGIRPAPITARGTVSDLVAHQRR